VEWILRLVRHTGVDLNAAGKIEALWISLDQ